MRCNAARYAHDSSPSWCWIDGSRAESDFPLDLSVYEDVDSVVVTTRAGAQRTVPKTGYRYDRAAKRLRFNAGVLGAQDQELAVNVAKYCQPVVK